jgi:glycosyltransferase involved in cell wall biosynthesis
MTPPDISVVICAHTFNRWPQLQAAVASVQAQRISAREIVVVVDENRDLLNRVHSDLSEVQALANQHEPGLAGARNTGVEAVQGSIVAFLDDDAMAEPDWLEHMVHSYLDEQVIGVGGAVVPMWPAGGRPGWFPEEFDWVVGCTYRGMPSTSAAVRNFIGANMSFRRMVFDQVSFYPGIGHAGGRPLGGSDPDFCIRVHARWPDHLLLYEPHARVNHQVSVERARWAYFVRRCFNEGAAKAVLTKRVGSRQALELERVYVRRTLPAAVARSFGQMLRSRRPGAALEAGAVVAGLGVTTAGYGTGVMRRPFRDLPRSGR